MLLPDLSAQPPRLASRAAHELGRGENSHWRLRGLQNRTCFLGPGGFMLGPDVFAFPPGAYGFLVCKMGMLMISWSPQPPCRMGVRFKQAKCETPAKGPRQL